MQPVCSVIIPVFNGSIHVPALLECLAAQTYKNAEYIVIDNGSTDNSYASILKEAKKYAHLPVRLLQEKTVKSAYAARNTGIRAAAGEILAFTDVDCRPTADWLNNLMRQFAEKDVGIVAGAILPKQGVTAIERYSARRRLLSQDFTLTHSFKPYGQTANLALRRQVFEQIGLFRPFLYTGGDADICWRASMETAWQLVFQPDAIVLHCHRTSIAGLVSQFFRYGIGVSLLTRLYGFRPQRQTTNILLRLGRWLKEELLPPSSEPERENRYDEFFNISCELAFDLGLMRGKHVVSPAKLAQIDKYERQDEGL